MKICGRCYSNEGTAECRIMLDIKVNAEKEIFWFHNNNKNIQRKQPTSRHYLSLVFSSFLFIGSEMAIVIVGHETLGTYISTAKTKIIAIIVIILVSNVRTRPAICVKGNVDRSAQILHILLAQRDEIIVNSTFVSSLS